MEMQGSRELAVTQQQAWNSLNDPEVLKACIPGCETLAQTEDGGFTATMTLRIGPVSAKFKGKLTLSDVQAPQRYTLHFDGQGGMAGFGKGSAQVELAPAEGGTKLSYSAKAQVGGKLAQVGSRLVDAAAGKITNDFFAAFNARVQADALAAGETLAAASGGNDDGRGGDGGDGGDGAVPDAAGTGSPSWPRWVWWAGAAALGLVVVVLSR